MTDRKNFNPQQWEAVTTLEGPVLVIAGAGSGKTRIITSRIVHLIENGISPHQILGVTFTNKAAEEMRSRVQKLTDHHVIICTFHSLGVRVLKECIDKLGYSRNFTIYDEDDAEKLLKVCLSELGLLEKKIDFKALRHLISKAKNALVSPEVPFAFDASIEVEEAFPKAYALYQSKLQECGAVDFDDLLFLTVKIWQNFPEVLDHYQNRWPFILIDEYQDTNEAQYTMAQLLAQKKHNLFVVGDPDQSIYSWRGANIRNILNFKNDYPEAKIIPLEQNYRSCTNILNASNGLINHNFGRFEKELWSDLGPGEKIKLFAGEGERDEASFVAEQVENFQSEGISLNDMAVFYRTNAQSRPFEDVLIRYRIPYIIIGGISFYQRREIKDILAFLRICQSGADYVSFARTINLPKRGFGDATLEKIRRSASLEQMTIFGYCEHLVGGEPLVNSLKLSAKQKENLLDYVQIIRQLRSLSKEGSIPDLVREAISLTQYVRYLSEDKESFEERKENLSELIAKAVEWEISTPEPSLETFLEELSLKSSLDEADPSHEKLNLMTIHNSKGLEFNAAFLVGLEEDLFPHVNIKNGGDEKGIEEERRLCYVGMTRAKERLSLSYCRTRYLWGTLRHQRPSRFLKEIPLEYLEKYSPYTSPKTFYRETPKPIPLDQPLTKQEIYTAGERIFHKEFGTGQIKETYEGSMGLTYKVLFDKDQSLKTLVAKYAVLNKI